MHSIYPTRPSDSHVLVSVSPNEFGLLDRLVVWATSVMFVGGPLWVPALFFWLRKKLRSLPKDDKKSRIMYTSLAAAFVTLYAVGPHRSERVGKWLKIRHWSIWKSWLRFVALEVIADRKNPLDFQNQQAIVAVSPHGVFPFALALTTIGDVVTHAFGLLHPVVATATECLPFVRDVLSWLGAVDASGAHVDRALATGARLGVAPGGIAEMFEGYPKPGCHPDEETMILRSGMFRKALQHGGGIPLIPVYCFGSTKMLKRLVLPHFVERLSLMLRASLVIFFGQFGPIPFRQKLLYVIGESIRLPPDNASSSMEDQVETLRQAFCTEMQRIFDRHKASYGWEHKNLRILLK